LVLHLRSTSARRWLRCPSPHNLGVAPQNYRDCCTDYTQVARGAAALLSPPLCEKVFVGRTLTLATLAFQRPDVFAIRAQMVICNRNSRHRSLSMASHITYCSHQFSGKHARRERPLLQARQIPIRSNAGDEVAQQRYLDPIRAVGTSASNKQYVNLTMRNWSGKNGRISV